MISSVHSAIAYPVAAPGYIHCERRVSVKHALSSALMPYIVLPCVPIATSFRSSITITIVNAAAEETLLCPSSFCVCLRISRPYKLLPPLQLDALKHLRVRNRARLLAPSMTNQWYKLCSVTKSRILSPPNALPFLNLHDHQGLRSATGKVSRRLHITG